MAGDDRTARIEAVLAAAGPAHHQAFIETDGDDPEWPAWYAHHVAADIRAALDQPDLTESRIVWALVSAADAHNADAGDTPWPHFYAEWMAERLV